MIYWNVWRVNAAHIMEAVMQIEAGPIEFRQSTFELAREGLLAIRDGQGTRVEAHEGALWVTEEGDLKDTVVSAGESFTIRHAGLTVITALSASRLTVEEPVRETLARPPDSARADVEWRRCA